MGPCDSFGILLPLTITTPDLGDSAGDETSSGELCKA